MNRLLPGMAGPLGFFHLDLLTPLGIVVWMGYAFSLWYASHLSLESTVLLLLFALACTGLITGYFRSLLATKVFYAAVNGTKGFSFYWVYTRLLMRTCAAGDKLRAVQKNLQYSKVQFHQPILQTYF